MRSPAGRKGGIELRELLHEDPDRPAVDDDMVQDQKQDVVVGAEPQQAGPEQRRAAYVDGCPGFLLGLQLRLLEQKCLRALVAGWRPACEVFDDEG